MKTAIFIGTDSQKPSPEKKLNYGQTGDCKINENGDYTFFPHDTKVASIPPFKKQDLFIVNE